MSFVGKRISFTKDNLYLWLVVDEDDEFIYVTYIHSSSGKVLKHLKSLLEKFPIYTLESVQLELF